MLEFAFTDTLTTRLEAGIKASVDFTAPMRTIANMMRTQTIERFEAETGPDGIKWLPSQRAEEDGGLTLTDKGHLRQSITSASDATAAVAGTNLIYAAIHQFGGSVRGRTSRRHQNVPKPRVFPARPFMGFGQADLAEIEAVLDAHLIKALAA